MTFDRKSYVHKLGRVVKSTGKKCTEKQVLIKRTIGPLTLFLVTVVWVLTTAPASQAQSVLRAGTLFLPPGKGNLYRGITLPAVMPYHAIFDTLTALGENGEVVPWLATEWRSENAVNWTFRLRPNVKFSNGEPFNADAVVASAEHMMTPTGRGETIGSTLYHVVAARAVDDLTVEIDLSEPDAIFPLHASVWRIPAPKHWAELGTTGFAVDPVGTGPFAVTEWLETAVKLVAYRESWRPPKVDALDIIQIPDQTARLQALLSGAVNFAMGLAPEDRPILEQAGGQIVFRLTTMVHFIGFLTRNDTPLKDVRLRKAMNFAVDREAIIREILDGSTAPAAQLAFPGAFGFNDDLAPYPHDPDRARALMIEAGYPYGFDIVINVSLGRGSNDSLYFQQIAADLRQVGINADLRIGTQAQNQRALFNGEMEGDAFNLFVRGHDPLNAYRLRACSGRATERVPYHCDDDLLPLIDQARAQTDAARAEPLYAAVLAHEYEDPPALFLWQGPEFDGIGPGVTGYRPNQDFINFHEISLQP